MLARTLHRVKSLFVCMTVVLRALKASVDKAGNKGVVYYELDSIYGVTSGMFELVLLQAILCWRICRMPCQHDSFLLDAVSIGPAVKGHEWQAM